VGVAVGISGQGNFGGPAFREVAEASCERHHTSKNGEAGCAARGDRQAGDRACAAPFVRHASFGERCGYTNRPRLAGAYQRGDDADLYARDGQAGLGRAESVGLLVEVEGGEFKAEGGKRRAESRNLRPER